jgi:hypothetical protein
MATAIKNTENLSLQRVVDRNAMPCMPGSPVSGGLGRLFTIAVTTFMLN